MYKICTYTPVSLCCICHEQKVFCNWDNNTITDWYCSKWKHYFSHQSSPLLPTWPSYCAVFCTEYMRVIRVSSCQSSPLSVNSNVILSTALDPSVHGVSLDRINLNKAKEAVTHGGLGVITAGVFLAGEMAGSGVLALPAAMVGTGG